MDTGSGDSVPDIKQIVEYLKQPPFSRTDSLVSFASMPPQQLLQLVNDVLAHLDSKHKKDLRDEPAEITAHRMLDFIIGTLHYSPPPFEPSIIVNPASLSVLNNNGGNEGSNTFGSGLMAGDKNAVYPLLLWMLSRLPQLTTRAYLARFLRPFDVPADMASDNMIIQLYAMYAQKQAEFKEIHMGIEKVRESSMDVKGLTKEVKQLESEKEQLSNKLRRMREKMKEDAGDDSEEEHHATFQAMLTVTNRLRMEQEEEARIYQQREEQLQKIDRLERTRRDALKKLEEIQGLMGSSSNIDAGKVLGRLRDQVQEKRTHVDVKLVQEISEREREVKKISSVLSSSSYSYEEVVDMERNLRALARDVEELERKRDEKNGGSDGKVGLIRERMTVIDKRLEHLKETVSELQEEKKEIEEEREKAVIEITHLQRSHASNVRSEADMKVYLAELQQQTQVYKQQKLEIDALQTELGVLQNTYQILSSRSTLLSQQTSSLEQQHNLTGYADVTQQLTHLSVQKKEADDEKGMTLESMSAMIDQILQKVQEKKERLAPLIKELKRLRQEHDRVQREWQEKTAEEKRRGIGFESERLGLLADLHEKQREKEQTELEFHQETMLRRIHAWKEDLIRDNNAASSAAGASVASASGGDDVKTSVYKERLEKLLAEQEQKHKVLRKEKKTLSDHLTDHVHQKKLFDHWKVILERKLVHLEHERVGGGGGGGGGMGGGGGGGVADNDMDRMVFD